ncbi:hypothetical protein [Taibaiella koreensis]|uniref:hypothetical protein n=1 Tax=Taibaiella koreensis TaxID=1268548 RepID=UPI000E59C293|nr:hypothetical protein [Taibaiella koreensis]
MKRPVIGFWAIYTLGFTVALPTFLYYTADDLPNAGPLPGQSAAASFFYLGLGALLWLIAIVLYGRFFLLQTVWGKRKLLRTIDKGISIPARIKEKTVKKVRGGMEVLDLNLSFTNLSGTPVTARYELNDARPAERRFEPGSSLDLRAYDDGNEIHLLPATVQVSVRLWAVVIYTLGFLLILAFALGYPLWSYQWESQGYGWRFLKLWHPWLLVLAINLGCVFLLRLFFLFLSKATGSASQLKWALYGIRTTATITDYRQTGLTINDQPQIQFEVHFTDKWGARQQATHKEIVTLVDLHRLQTGDKEIIYLPDKPLAFLFYENLSLS